MSQRSAVEFGIDSLVSEFSCYYYTTCDFNCNSATRNFNPSGYEKLKTKSGFQFSLNSPLTSLKQGVKVPHHACQSIYLMS